MSGWLRRAIFNTLEQKLRVALAIVIVAVVVIAPLAGVFLISPALAAIGVTSQPLTALLGVAIAEALAILLLVILVSTSK